MTTTYKCSLIRSCNLHHNIFNEQANPLPGPVHFINIGWAKLLHSKVTTVFAKCKAFFPLGGSQYPA